MDLNKQKLKDESLTFSVIISTYNRSKELKETLSSILTQETTLPKEVLIVDDSDDGETERLFEDMRKEFEAKNINLIYIKNPKQKSLTVARNIGVEHSRGDVIVFLDDDVTLDKNFFAEVLYVYKNYPNVKGVQGFWGKNIKMTFLSQLLNTLKKFFLLSHYERDKCRVLPCFNQTYPYMLTGITRCQWLSGCNQSYVRSIFKEFRYDEKLLRYSFGEDLDFSYRVYSKYSGSLFITPKAKLVHRGALKTLTEKLIYMQVVYSHYLFHKNMGYSTKNRLAFGWSRIGTVILNILGLMFPRERSVRERLFILKHSVKAEILCFRYRNKIRKGNLEFLRTIIE